MVREREPPRIASPRKTSHTMDKPPGFLSAPQQSGAAPSAAQPQRPVQPTSRVPHDQTLVAQKIREGADPYAQKSSVDRSSHYASVQKNAHVFNIPHANHARPEHHRHPSQPSGPRIPSHGSDSAADVIGKGFRLPSSMSRFGHQWANATQAGPTPVEIPQPSNAAPSTIPAAPRPMFSTNATGPISAGQWRQPQSQPPSHARPPPASNVVDLTGPGSSSSWGPGRVAVGEDAYDPGEYMDAAQANENIKALLEGAFEEDEGDKPKRRLRTRGPQKFEEDGKLAKKMKSLDVSTATDGKKEPSPEEDEAHEEEEEEDDGTVEGLKVKLLPHQIDGVNWMLDKEVGERKKKDGRPMGGILADDMGLGKTIQALGLILSNPRPSQKWVEEHPERDFPTAAGKGTLVVAPLALIKQWESEIKDKVLPSHKLKVLVHHGPSRTKSFEDLKKYEIVITTYQTLMSEHEGSSDDGHGLQVGCFGLHWYRVILDEAHSIKNRNAKTTKAAYNLKTVYRWCLTGTPMQNNLDEIQSLIRFLQIKPYMDLKTWKDSINTPMKNGRGGLAMKRLRVFLQAFMKRRTKEVLKKEGGLTTGKGGGGEDGEFKIVARTVQTVAVDFDAHERTFYNRLAERTEKSLEEMMGGKKQDYIGALVLLLRLRQMCNHPDLIRGGMRNDPDAIVARASSQPERRGNATDDGLGDITDMFKDLAVQTKKCDICQAAISKAEAAEGAIRCADCEADLADQSQVSVSKKKKKKKKKHQRNEKKDAAAQRRRARKIIESDDEDADDDAEDEGEWVVPPSEQDSPHLGKAGGPDDEDAEGGGEWLVSEDEETDGDDSSSDDDASLSVDGGRHEEDRTRKSRSVASTKIRNLIDILEKETASHKVIVFSEFTSMLDITAPFLHDAGFRLVRYDGRMRNDDREAALDALRHDPATRVLLCSLRCGSLGLNLTAASRVVILEPFWNPFVEEQAIDRVHRLNQTRDVTVYRLTVRDSVEERIIALQAKKRELAAAAIEGQKAVGRLSMKDILHLFRRDAEHDGSHDDEGGPGSTGALREKVRVAPSVSLSSSSSSQHMYGPGGEFWNDAGPRGPRPPASVPKTKHMNTFGEAYGRR